MKNTYELKVFLILFLTFSLNFGIPTTFIEFLLGIRNEGSIISIQSRNAIELIKLIKNIF